MHRIATSYWGKNDLYNAHGCVIQYCMKRMHICTRHMLGEKKAKKQKPLRQIAIVKKVYSKLRALQMLWIYEKNNYNIILTPDNPQIWLHKQVPPRRLSVDLQHIYYSTVSTPTYAFTVQQMQGSLYHIHCPVHVNSTISESQNTIINNTCI